MLLLSLDSLHALRSEFSSFFRVFRHLHSGRPVSVSEYSDHFHHEINFKSAFVLPVIDVVITILLEIRILSKIGGINEKTEKILLVVI